MRAVKFIPGHKYGLQTGPVKYSHLSMIINNPLNIIRSIFTDMSLPAQEVLRNKNNTMPVKNRMGHFNTFIRHKKGADYKVPPLSKAFLLNHSAYYSRSICHHRFIAYVWVFPTTNSIYRGQVIGSKR